VSCAAAIAALPPPTAPPIGPVGAGEPEANSSHRVTGQQRLLWPGSPAQSRVNAYVPQRPARPAIGAEIWLMADIEGLRLKEVAESSGTVSRRPAARHRTAAPHQSVVRGSARTGPGRGASRSTPGTASCCRPSRRTVRWESRAARARTRAAGLLRNQDHAALDLGCLDRESRLLVVARRAQFERPSLSFRNSW
jgi:hypothetical protein